MTKMQEQQQQTQLYKIRRRGGAWCFLQGGAWHLVTRQYTNGADRQVWCVGIPASRLRRDGCSWQIRNIVRASPAYPGVRGTRPCSGRREAAASLSSPRRAAASPPGAPDYSLNRRPVKRAHPALTELRVSATNEYPNSRVFLFSITHYVSRSYELLGMQD